MGGSLLQTHNTNLPVNQSMALGNTNSGGFNYLISSGGVQGLNPNGTGSKSQERGFKQSAQQAQVKQMQAQMNQLALS